MSETELELCRLCAVSADETNSQKIFERNHRKLLRQIEELIGLKLKNTKDLPKHICKPCEEQTVQAHEFRERCLQTQLNFTIAHKKTKNMQQKKHKLKEEAPPIEEVVLDETKLVKVEEGDEEENYLPQPHHNLEVMLKYEQINDDESSNEINRLADNNDQHTASDNGDTVPFDIADTQTHSEGKEYKVEETRNTTNQMSLEEPTRTKRKYKQRQRRDPNESKVKHDPKVKREPKKKRDPNEKHESKKKREPKENKEISDAKKKRVYICDLCGLSFTTPFNLTIHQRRHVGDKQYHCTICPEKCYTKWQLERHIRRHTGELPFQCRYCERRFIDHYPRIRHERSHTGKRPFACTECEKTFSVADTLKNHMLTHTGIRTFHCKECDRMFLRRTHLITHYRSITHKQNEEKLRQLEESQEIVVAQQVDLALVI